MASGFGDLPYEVLLEIFSHMSIEDLALSVQQVSSHWRAVSQDQSLWKNKVFIPDCKISDEVLKNYLKHMPALRAYCPQRRTEASVVSVLCDCCKNLRRLEFARSSKITNCSLKKIFGELPDLEHLVIPIPQESEQLQFGDLIGRFQKLTTLSFGNFYVGVPVTNNILKGVADGCPSLVHVDLGNRKFKDVDIKYFLDKKGQQLLSFTVRCYISTMTHTLLTNCSKLEYLLYDHRNKDLPASCMQLLSKLTNMCDMSLCNFGKDHTRHIPDIFSKQSLSRLVKLDIYDCRQFDGELLGRVLRNTPLLTKLSIFYSSEPMDDGFQYIKMCRHIEHLDISCCSCITDAAIDHISIGCPKLKRLDVRCCYELTNKSVQYLSDRCQELEYLDLQRCDGITDTAFENMKFKKLCHLIIKYHQNITGIHFNKIPSNLTSLIVFNVQGCMELNFDNVDRLQEAMPKLKIIRRRPADDDEEEDFELGEVAFFNT